MVAAPEEATLCGGVGMGRPCLPDSGRDRHSIKDDLKLKVPMPLEGGCAAIRAGPTRSTAHSRAPCMVLSCSGRPEGLQLWCIPHG